jgi:hypothetical protein
MNIHRPLIPVGMVFCLLFAFWPESEARSITASHPLPHVSLAMEKPEFWIKKIANPNRLLLTPEEIRRMNENNLKRNDLYLFNVKDLQEELSREEVLALLKEDWDGFVKPGETRYGRTGIPLQKPFWDELVGRLNTEFLKEKNKVLFGLVVKRGDIRVFPSEEQSKDTPGPEAFDRFQHSSLSPGSLIGIYYFSKDNRWAYVQTQFVRGWVDASAIAVAGERSKAAKYLEPEERLVITGSFVKVFQDPSLRHVAFLARMGDSFPRISPPAQGATVDPVYTVQIPLRDGDGRVEFGKGYLPRDGTVHEGFLAYTQENVARQAFKMLHEPYGWGDMFDARDCSRFVMDLFASFGIIMPRNSLYQGRMGKDLGGVGWNSAKSVTRGLDRCIPLATLLRLPGHIMLYLGKHQGRHYAVHNVWGIQKGKPPNGVLEKIGRVEVSDLSLGESGAYGSLLQRIVDVRFIGPNDNFP